MLNWRFLLIVISKKRIQVIIMVIMIGILTFTIQVGGSLDKTKEVNSNIDNEKIIVLDAGHGTPDEGAQSKNGTTEAKINLNITYKTKELLEQNGYKVILTRTGDEAIYDSKCTTIKEMKNSDIKNRVKIGNESNADIFVSIHLNKIQQSQYWGWQTFYKKGNEQGKKLSENIQNNITEVIQKENKRVPLEINNIYIIKNVKIPTTIVECGFLSNEEEEKLLQDEEYQSKLALGIYNGINEYFN